MRIKVLWVIFGVIASLFVVSATPLSQMLRLHGDFRSFAVPLGILGALLTGMALSTRTSLILKVFLVGTGASAVGWPFSLYLHRVLAQIFPTEPVTYVLFFYVFTPAFVVAAAGALLIGIKRLLFSR